MRVRLFGRHAVVVLVPVMLVVNVQVIVLQALVGVCVPVPLAEEEFQILQSLNGGKQVAALGDNAAQHVRRLAEHGVVDLLPQP